MNARPKREPKLQCPELPQTNEPGFWRAAFIATLVERQAGQRLYAKSRDRAEMHFLYEALYAQKAQLRMQLDYWLEEIGGMAGTGKVSR